MYKILHHYILHIYSCSKHQIVMLENEMFGKPWNADTTSHDEFVSRKPLFGSPVVVTVLQQDKYSCKSLPELSSEVFIILYVILP